jgi:general secretion pathway protein H
MIQRNMSGCQGSTLSARNAGFTLIELTVVIVILSVVALLVLPRLPFAHERDLSTSARTLAGTLRYLEDRAISTKQYYRLRINLVDGSMKVTRVLPENEEVEDTDAMFTNLALREGIGFADVTTSHSGKISEGEAVLDFSPLGSEEFFLFHLKTEDDKRFFTVALYPGSGRVEVSEGYQEGTLSGTDQEKKFSLEEKEDVR